MQRFIYLIKFLKIHGMFTCTISSRAVNVRQQKQTGEVKDSLQNVKK